MIKRCFKIIKQFYFLWVILILPFPIFSQQWQKVTNPFPHDSDGSANWADYNNDNKVDLFIGGSNIPARPTSKIFRNNGTDIFREINAGLIGSWNYASARLDYDGDGLSELQGQTFSRDEPSGLAAESGNHLIELKWRKNQGKDISKYYIYYSTSLQTPVKKDSTESYADTLFIVRKLHNNVKYYFWISAIDKHHNESKLSQPISGSPYKIPSLSLTETSINIQNISLGNSSQIILDAINNTPDPVSISSIKVSDPVFKVIAETGTLSPNDSLKIKVVFNPKSFGNFSSELKIYTGIDTLSLPLKGSSPFPELFADMSKLNFLYTPKNSTRCITLGISNNSVNKLEIDSIFTQTKNFYPRIPETIVPAKSFIYIPIYFSPDSIASFSDTLIFLNNSETQVLKIPLTGNSKLAELALRRTSLNFDSAALGSGKLQKMTFYNLSKNILEISSIKNSIKSFNISTNLPRYINGHDSLTLNVQFYSKSPGVFNDTTYIGTNGGDTVLYFKAVCPFPEIELSLDTLDFGNTIIDSSAKKQIYISNNSISYLKIDSIKFSAHNFKTTSITSLYLHNNHPRLLNIEFQPNSSGVFYDSLIIFNSSPQSPVKIFLTGKGETLTEVKDYSNKIPDEFSLSQNYPNPFNPTTTISYTVPKASFVTIKLFDMLGKEVVILVNEEKQDGTYNIRFDGSKLSSGIYFYTMQAEDFVSTRKLILLK